MIVKSSNQQKNKTITSKKNKKPHNTKALPYLNVIGR